MTLRTPCGQSLRNMLGETPASSGKLVEAPQALLIVGEAIAEMTVTGVMAPGRQAR